jgi:hypothetical protein
MNQIAFDRPPGNPHTDCAALTAMAERELSAFFNAVTDLFGSEQAELSAEDWLHELNESDVLPASAGQWRLMTTRASTRLASRVNACPCPLNYRMLRRKSCVFLLQVLPDSSALPLSKN